MKTWIWRAKASILRGTSNLMEKYFKISFTSAWCNKAHAVPKHVLIGWMNLPESTPKNIFLLHNNQYLEHPHRCSLCEPGKIFLTSKFSYLLFCDPTHKTEMRTAYRCELLIANHMDQSLWLGNQKQGAAVRSYLLHSSLAGAQLCCDFYQPQQKHTGKGCLFLIQF
jgi:hypothetical protein